MQIDAVEMAHARDVLCPPIRRDFHLIGAGAALLLILIVWQEQLLFLFPLRLLLGFAYVLFVPGYCLQAALFPRADDLDGIERTGLSLGLSVALVPVVALILDRLPWGLHLWPIVWGQLAVIGLAVGVALWRRARLPADVVYAPGPTWQPRAWWRALPPFERRVYTLLAGALLLATLAVAWVFLVPAPDAFMTEFYVLGAEGRAEDYPRAAQVGEPLQVTLGLVNRERAARRYQVEIWAVDPWTEERQQVADAGPIELAVGERREWPLTWHMPRAGQDQVVEFLLFTPSESDHEVGAQHHPYRRLRLWLDVASAPAPAADEPAPAPDLQPAPTAVPTAAATATPVPLPAVRFPQRHRLLQPATLHMRPDANSRGVTTVPAGSTLLVTDESDDGRWWQICCLNVDGVYMWQLWVDKDATVMVVEAP